MKLITFGIKSTFLIQNRIKKVRGEIRTHINHFKKTNNISPVKVELKRI